MKKLINLFFSVFGIVCFLICIIEGVDGIGRFPCILFGTIFVLIGTLVNFDKRKNK